MLLKYFDINMIFCRVSDGSLCILSRWIFRSVIRLVVTCKMCSFVHKPRE